MTVVRRLLHILTKNNKIVSNNSIEMDIAIIRDHFDTEYYLKKNRDVMRSGMDPITHFCEYGWKEMRDPSPGFSVEYYLNKYDDIDVTKNPFVHYLEKGQAEGRTSVESDIEDDDLDIYKFLQQDFDSDFYTKRYPDVIDAGIDPIKHYIKYGWREGRDPSPLFSTNHYLSTYSDIAAAGVNPLWHYVVAGRSENRQPLPQSNIMASSDNSKNIILDDTEKDIIDFFDSDYYLETYPEAATTRNEAIRHFCKIGWKEGRNPSAKFSIAGYLQEHRDVEASGVNPLWHYAVAGRHEGRVVISPNDYQNQLVRSAINTDIEDIRSHFDSNYYLFKYADVAASGIDPLEHYWNSGWTEGRDPCASFSTTYYLDTNKDVATLNINPFWHFIVAGQTEGRAAQHPGGHRIERLRNLDSLEGEVIRWAKSGSSPKLLGSGELSDIIINAKKDGSRELLISVGHDNYLKTSGGVQLCEHREEAISSTNGRLYLNIYPWNPLPRLSHSDDEYNSIICLTMNGEEIGSCQVADLVKAVQTVTPEFNKARVVVHQLLGHSPEHISKIINATGRRECWLWLHDFLTVCVSYTLQRNDVLYCNAPAINSNACTLCRYGLERINHVNRIKEFFNDIDVHILSPSDVAAEIWSKKSGLVPASLSVIPHMTLEWSKRNTPPPQSAQQVTVGFLGTPAPHKGWNVFEHLVRVLESNATYRFVFLGTSTLPAKGIDYHPVHVTAQDPDAMIKAVKDEKVDLVLHWASWPETFSLSTFEAYAGGAYVITNEISGNVAATVRKFNRGVVLENQSELIEFFESGKAILITQALRADRRKNEVRHQLSRMVHDAMDLDISEVR